jgi:hypothetical protein
MTPRTFELTLPLSVADAWRWLRDAERVTGCVAGARSVSMDTVGTDVLLRAKIGAAAQFYRTQWQQVTASPGDLQHHATVTVRTLDLEPVFQCDVTAALSAIPSTNGGDAAPEKTRLSLTVDVHTSSPSSPDPARVDDFLSRIVDEFEARLASDLQEEPAPEPPPAPASPAALPMTQPADERDGLPRAELPASSHPGAESPGHRPRNRTLLAALGLAAVALGITIWHSVRPRRPLNWRH